MATAAANPVQETNTTPSAAPVAVATAPVQQTTPSAAPVAAPKAVAAAPVQQTYGASENQEELMKDSIHKELAGVIRNDTTWLLTNPCCGGCGVTSKTTSSVLLNEQKCFCFESISRTEDCWTDEGFYVFMQKFGCCLMHKACPPGGGANDGVPMFACCNVRWGGQEDGPVKAEESAQLMKESFLLVYFIMGGFGFMRCADPCIYGKNKYFCCVDSNTSSGECCPSGQPFTYKRSKLCCCVDATRCGGDGRDGVPRCAVCGAVVMAASEPAETEPLAPPAQSGMQQ